MHLRDSSGPNTFHALHPFSQPTHWWIHHGFLCPLASHWVQYMVIMSRSEIGSRVRSRHLFHSPVKAVFLGNALFSEFLLRLPPTLILLGLWVVTTLLLLWISLVVPLHLTHTFVNSSFIKLSWNYSNLRSICFLLGPWLTEQIANILQRTGCKNYLNIYVCLCVCVYIYASDTSI